MEIKENRVFITFANIVLILASASCVIPFILLFVTSITDENYLIKQGYTFFPRDISVKAYEYLFRNSEIIFKAYGITILVTVIGTTACLFMGSLLAYAISRMDLPGNKIMSFLVVFTILFNGGLVPTYIIYTQYFQIKNTIWALIIPRLLMTGFNVLLMRTYFRTSIPPSLIESTKIDGAGEFKVFFKIIIPLSLPIMATIGLMSGLAYWNDWFNGLIYITDQKLFSLQVLLNQILMNIQFLANMDVGRSVSADTVPSVSARMAIAAVGVIPILVIYPFFQKYFVKGITIGAVKG
jgi:putative aldouronate transport system permease protein